MFLLVKRCNHRITGSQTGLVSVGKNSGNICDWYQIYFDSELNGLSKHANIYGCCMLQLLG